ncbi:MAG TPA: LysM domain-containing protein [Solirubrobacterales bacterium]|jgi:LysM repeat protein|nr:LysM domain-containing protein [Solirubrobacterales bacterium]
MEKRTSAFARIFAAIALAGAVIVVIVVIASSLGDSDSSTKAGHGHGHSSRQGVRKTTAKTYVVKSGDTLVSIAHRTGVPVVHILALNPEVDPQILIAGQILKLR